MNLKAMLLHLGTAGVYGILQWAAFTLSLKALLTMHTLGAHPVEEDLIVAILMAGILAVGDTLGLIQMMANENRWRWPLPSEHFFSSWLILLVMGGIVVALGMHARHPGDPWTPYIWGAISLTVLRLLAVAAAASVWGKTVTAKCAIDVRPI